MAPQAGWFTAEQNDDRLVLTAGGNWVTASLSELDAGLRNLAPEQVREARIDLTAVDNLDTAGAWVLLRTREQFRTQGIAAEFAGVKAVHGSIIDRIAEGHVEAAPEAAAYHPIIAMIERTGAAVIAALREAGDLLSFLGLTTITTLRSLRQPSRIRFIPLLSQIEKIGLNAMPIVGLMSFMVGVVVAYQGAGQLTRFGAEIFVVNLLGVSMLREMGILLTAIIVAGRSGSAFAAQIGTMQVSEEIDAMRTIGLDPVEVLVLPRIFALLIALPLLAVFADLMGIVGGALMAIAVLDISLVQFLGQFKNAISIWALWVGLIKAPVFGLVIGLIGCREGLSVSGGAESVGHHTTKAVVVSIFMVILLDAVFSVFFSYIGV